MREQYAATIIFIPPDRETGWRLHYKRRIAIHNFLHIGSTQLDVGAIQHVTIVRNIIRERQAVAIEL